MKGSFLRIRANPYQLIAMLLCMVLAVAMILNVQMGGEAMWFWYAYAYRHGAKLYSQLHFALQPFFVLETAAWTGLFGTKLVVYEVPALLHALFLAVGVALVLRKSDWPDWQKAILLFGTFLFVVVGHSYRFDDYHVVTESLVFYALYLLLLVNERRADENFPQQAPLSLLLGLVCGVDIITRVTDGLALSLAVAICLFALMRGRKLANVGLFLMATAVTIWLVISLTGDSFSAYLSSSIFRAAASKGGTGSILWAPFKMEWNSLGYLRGQKKPVLAMVFMAMAGTYVGRRRPGAIGSIILVQLGIAALLIDSYMLKRGYDPTTGVAFEFLAVFLTVGVYLMAFWAIYRYLQTRREGERGTWDVRCVLMLLPICQWASYSAASSAEPILNYYAPAAVVLVLIPVLQPFRKHALWANPMVISLTLVLIANGLVSKAVMPYSWQNYRFPPMFTEREWFRHPAYGWMYIDRENLSFDAKVCSDVGSRPGMNQPTLLSLPYPFPNYFCATPPWHNYVQTFFDTTTRATIEQLVRELKANPPEWIVYQRQINIMEGAERLYNHGHPLAQRELDALIMGNLASGQWTLVDESDYLHTDYWLNRKETDWYIVHTRPSSALPTTAAARRDLPVLRQASR